MTDTMLIHCDAVHGAFRQWQAEQEPLDTQLSESLAALSAYQTHLDDWQRQLASEREELRASRQQWEQEQSNAQHSETRLSDLTCELSAARDEIQALTARLISGEQELHAERERFERERSAAAQIADSDTSSFAAAELSAARVEIDHLTAALDSRADELRAAREQLEQDRAAADSTHARLTQVSEELSAARGEIANLTKCLLTSAEELRTERQKNETDESTADQHQNQLAEVTSELNAARDKIAALTTMLLARTEELRTLDVQRAEAGAELEMARVRERELVAELEELRQTREWEHAQWADDSRNLREMVEHRLEGVDPNNSTEHGGNSQSGERRVAKNGERAGENPVFASVKEQFGKLRQQRAMDRPASKKAR
jgi:chromosome segregation ATPase